MRQVATRFFLTPWVVVRIVEIEPEFRPGWEPDQPGTTDGGGQVRDFVNPANDFASEGTKLRHAHPCFRPAMEFLNGPLGFVGDLPGEDGRMAAEFSEERNQDVLEKSFPAYGKMPPRPSPNRNQRTSVAPVPRMRANSRSSNA